MSIFSNLASYAKQPWFPFLVATISGANMFVIFLSAPTAVLFISGILARPKMWLWAAFINAAGTVVGAAALVYVVQNNGGEAYIQSTFPSVFDSSAWNRTKALTQDYGTASLVFVSALPAPLQPVILFGVLTGIPNTVLLSCLLAGRMIKYTVMGYCAHHAPRMLKYFGIKNAPQADKKSK